MDPKIIGAVVVLIILIIIGIYFYLKNSCKNGEFYSLSKFKCLTCKSCPQNKWYNPKESCKDFTDKKMPRL